MKDCCNNNKISLCIDSDISINKRKCLNRYFKLFIKAKTDFTAHLERAAPGHNCKKEFTQEASSRESVPAGTLRPIPRPRA